MSDRGTGVTTCHTDATVRSICENGENIYILGGTKDHILDAPTQAEPNQAESIMPCKEAKWITCRSGLANTSFLLCGGLQCMSPNTYIILFYITDKITFYVYVTTNWLNKYILILSLSLNDHIIVFYVNYQCCTKDPHFSAIFAIWD